MRTQTLSLFLAAGLLLSASCKKSDDGNGNGNNPGASGLTAGKATMSFSSTSTGVGSFNGSEQAVNSAVYSSGAGNDQVTITAAERSGASVKTAQLSISLPKASGTANGSITGDFAHPSGAKVVPVLLIGASGASGSESYTSKTGTLTLTKLTTTEVEGTFSGTFYNETSKTSCDVTNGQFAGKF